MPSVVGIVIVLFSFLIICSNSRYPAAAQGPSLNCWPATPSLHPVIFKECLDIISKIISPGTESDIPLKFSTDPRQRPEFLLPKYWDSKPENCVLAVDFKKGVDGYDRTTMNDIKYAALAIAKRCVINSPHLGGIITPIGWQKKLEIMVGGFDQQRNKVLNGTVSSE